MKRDRWLLVVSYVLLVLSVGITGWIVEHNANQTQEKTCAVFRAQVKVNVELTLYARALNEGVTIAELQPTKTGQAVASDIRQTYSEVCGGSVD